MRLNKYNELNLRENLKEPLVAMLTFPKDFPIYDGNGTKTQSLPGALRRGFCTLCNKVWAFKDGDPPECPYCKTPAKDLITFDESTTPLRWSRCQETGFLLPQGFYEEKNKAIFDALVVALGDDNKIKVSAKRFEHLERVEIRPGTFLIKTLDSPVKHNYSIQGYISKHLFQILDFWLCGNNVWDFLKAKFDDDSVDIDCINAHINNPWIVGASKDKQEALMEKSFFVAKLIMQNSTTFETEKELLDCLQYPEKLRPYWPLFGIDLLKVSPEFKKASSKVLDSLIICATHGHLKDINLMQSLSSWNVKDEEIYEHPDFPEFLRKNAVQFGIQTGTAFEALGSNKSILEFNLLALETKLVTKKRSGLKRVEEFERLLRTGDSIAAIEALI